MKNNRNNMMKEEKELMGPTGHTGLDPRLIGPSMEEWMPPEQYRVMCDFMDGKLSLKKMQDYARGVLKKQVF